MIGQGLTLVLQMCTAMVLARLLSPEDFGLQGMVFAMTGFLGLFREGGLGVASVQRQGLTHEQTSTLFWINVAMGVLLATAAAAAGPALAVFFKEPRLLSVTLVSAAAFLFNGLAVQHRALLNRSMRFVTVATASDPVVPPEIPTRVIRVTSSFSSEVSPILPARFDPGTM